MKQESKIGILKYIAATGARGVKFEDQPETWYNPANDEAKTQVKDEYKGKQVEIMLADGKKTEFTSMVILETKKEDTTEAQPEVEEEQIIDCEDPEDGMTDEEKVKHRMGEEPKEEPGQIMGLLGKIKADMEARRYTKEVYAAMDNTKLETAKKGTMGLTYASWSEAWGALKRLHPTATFEVHENVFGLPYFMGEGASMGAFVKVSVTVMGLTHTVHLPVMDHSNKSIKKDAMTSFDVNKNIQRALVKGISLHGLGLYVFKGKEFDDTN